MYVCVLRLRVCKSVASPNPISKTPSTPNPHPPIHTIHYPAPGKVGSSAEDPPVPLEVQKAVIVVKTTR